MANLFQPSLSRATDADGNSFSGARLYFYATGTLTPASWFTDAAGTVPGVNPLVADSAGVFSPAYLDPDITYRIILQADGETIWDVDPVRGFDESQLAQASADAVSAAASANAASLAAQAAQAAAEERAAFIEDSANATPYATWAELDAATGMADGDVAVVFEDDGTHTDPVTAATVDNAGLYKYRDPDGWERIADASEAARQADRAEAAAGQASTTASALSTALENLNDIIEVGRPSTETLTTGSNPTSNYRVFAESGGIKQGMTIQTIRLYAGATGTLGVSLWSRSGNNMTRETSTATVDIDATGEQEIDVSALGITATADDQLIGWLPSNVGIVPQVAGTADEGGSYRSTIGGDVSSFADGTPDTYQMQIGFDLSIPVVTKDTIEELEAEDARLSQQEFPLAKARTTPHELTLSASPTALTARLAQIEGELIALRGDTYYVDSTATGAADGSSWTDAFTTIAAVAAVVQRGDTVYLNAPTSAMLGYYNGAWPAGVKVIGDAGPDGETWITARHEGTWTAVGDGRFYTEDASAEPRFVAYDFKQDTDGSVTGMDFTYAKWKRLLDISGFTVSQVAPWYGFLHENADYTAMSAGDWAWDAGNSRLYIYPSGSPSVSTVNDLAIWSEGDACVNLTSSGYMINGSWEGCTFFFAPATSGGEGYGLRNRYAQNFTSKRNVFIACGYHGEGYAGESRDSNAAMDNVYNGCAGGIPLVFYTNYSADLIGNHVADRLFNNGAPYLDWEGKPLDTGTWSSVRTAFSHRGNPGVYILDGIEYSRVYQIDPFKTILEHHSIAVPSAPASSYSVGARNTSYDAEITNANGYPIKCRDSIFLGGGSGPEVMVWYENCEFDSDGEAQTAFSFVTSPGVWKMGMKNCSWKPNLASPAEAFNGISDTRGGIALVDSDILNKGTGAIIGFSEDEPTDVAIYLRGNQIDADNGGPLLEIPNTMSLSDLSTAGSIESDGGNAFGQGIQTAVIRRADGATIATPAEFITAFSALADAELADAELNL